MANALYAHLKSLTAQFSVRCSDSLISLQQLQTQMEKSVVSREAAEVIVSLLKKVIKSLPHDVSCMCACLCVFNMEDRKLPAESSEVKCFVITLGKVLPLSSSVHLTLSSQHRPPTAFSDSILKC